MVRLLGEAQRHGNDPELFAGLVHACRYCGLFEQSIAAHAEARRLDPNVPTGVEQTYLMAGDVERLLASETPRVVAGADDGIRVMGLGLARRLEEARAKLAGMRGQARIPAFESWIEFLAAWIDRRRADMNLRHSRFAGLGIQDDPEAIFLEGWLLCDAGDPEAGLEYIQRAIARHYYAATTLSLSPQFDALRDDPRFQSLRADAEAGRSRALDAFRAAGGDRLLGLA
jgi:hypothetical protein